MALFPCWHVGDRLDWLRVIDGVAGDWPTAARLECFLHPQTSWMSREALLALPIFALGALAVLLDQPFVSLPFQTHFLVAVLASAVAVFGLVFLYCQARILRASLGVPAWREPALQPLIVITGLTEGLGLLLFLSVVAGPPPVWAMPAAIVALVARAGAWEYYRQRLKTCAPAVAALDRIYIPVHVLGHALPALLLASALFVPSMASLAPVAGLALASAGAWLKFDVVTRAAFTQGFSIAFVPVRGRK